jgi:hypothetical protein
LTLGAFRAFGVSVRRGRFDRMGGGGGGVGGGHWDLGGSCAWACQKEGRRKLCDVTVEMGRPLRSSASQCNWSNDISRPSGCRPR